ncbi:MAG: ZIP family metal transporter [Chloroflexota bacterium]
MSQSETLILGFIAGITIVLGLPLGRVRTVAPSLRYFLSAFATGILLFLLWDVLAHAWEPIDVSLANLHAGDGDIWPVLKYGSLFLGGVVVGLMSLVYYERFLDRGKRPEVFGPGAMAVGELPARMGLPTWASARRLAIMIALGIGLHNFGEGLAIGGSAASGEIGLATVLVIGFALHNATEGFGIVAPLAGHEERPSWLFLATMGLIGGAPTFAGTIVGRQFTSETMSVLFLSLAAGSILYVIVQLLGVAMRKDRKELLYWGIFVGLAAGFITDMVVTAGGA